MSFGVNGNTAITDSDNTRPGLALVEGENLCLPSPEFASPIQTRASTGPWPVRGPHRTS